MPRSIQDSRIALLINFIPPYRYLALKLLSAKVKELTVFLSTAMEPNRSWEPFWENINVILQKNIMLRRVWRHPQGFSEESYLHLPYDTLFHLIRLRPDVVISLEFGFRTMQAVVYRKLFPFSRLIVWVGVSERTEQGRGKVRTFFRRLMIRHADAFLVYGHSGSRYLIRFKVPEDRIFLAPPSPDNKPFLSIPLHREKPIAYRLLYVGRLVKLKGIDLFLQVLCQWAALHADRRLEFWLAGDGPMRKQLENNLLPDNLALSFLGEFPYKALKQIYSKAGIFVFPTLADSWGQVINEALASGLPILGSLHSQAVEDLVQENRNGWSFDPENSEDMLRAVSKSLETPLPLLDKMRIRSRKTAMNFSPGTMVDQIVRSIECCLR